MQMKATEQRTICERASKFGALDLPMLMPTRAKGDIFGEVKAL